MVSIKKPFISLLKLTVTVVVIVFLIGKLGWNDIVRTVTHAHPVWLISAFVIFFLSAWIGVAQWSILLTNRGIPLRFWRAFRLYFIGLFFNNFVMGGIVGDVVKVASIKSQDGKGMAGLAATFLDRFAGLWAMCGFAVIGSSILLGRGALNSGKIGTAVLALLVTFVLFAGIMVLLMCKPVQAFVFKITDYFAILKKIRIKEILSELIIEANDYHVLGKVTLLSAVIQFLRIGVHICVAGSLGLLTSANYQYFFIFVPIIAMLMTIPLPFGVREAAGGALFALAGFPAQEAFVMGFLASVVGIAASLIGGVLFVADKIDLQGKDNGKNIDCCSSSQ